MENFSKNGGMDQQQFKVSFSIGTKLLLSIVSLIILVIFFLSTATVLLVVKDKRAYIYSSQSKETHLAGQQLQDLVRHSTDTLRLSLATVDPTKILPLGPNKALDAMIQNQTDLTAVAVYLWGGSSNPPTETLTLTTQSPIPSTSNVTAEQVRRVSTALLRDSVAYINLSRPGTPATLGILFADVRLKNNPNGMPVALGIASLETFAKATRGMDLTVTTLEGQVLFDLRGSPTIIGDPLFTSAMSSATSRISQGSKEYEVAGVKYLGSYDSPGLGLLVLDRTEWSKAIRAVYSLGEKLALVALMAIAGAIIFAIFFSKSLSFPILRLYQATREVAKGNFSLDLKPTGRDEIGALTSSFNVMSKKIVELIKESVEKVQLENELAIASTVQQTLFPDPYFKNENILIQGHYQSATQCGGDWWGFFGSKNKFCMMIADATGHGVPSALITASARSCFSVIQKLANEEPTFALTPANLLSYANRVVYDASMGKIMMTFFVAVIDFEKKTLDYSSAGHNPPWLFRKGPGGFTLNSLTANGMRLGESRDAEPFEQKQIAIAPGDMLFLYTDGLTEGKNKSGAMYGKKRLRKQVESSLQHGPHYVVSTLMKDFLDYNDDKPLDDDVTLAVATIL